MSLRVGLVGTGYAARKRVEALRQEGRTQLVAVAGRDPDRTQTFGHIHDLKVAESWQILVQSDEIDLVIVATVNALHGPIVQAALTAHKHVVVEYPLALEVAQAEALVALAKQNRRLLHVGHIERLGGLHQAAQSHLQCIGNVHYVNYRTLNPCHPAPVKWSYSQELAGFPLISALSRIHRLTNLLGAVSQVYCHSRFESAKTHDSLGHYGSCLCSAQLVFHAGTVAELTYGKGERIWAYSRRMEIQGSQGALIFDQDQGVLVTSQGEQAVAVEPRRGLFAQDTVAVLDHLTEGTPLYVTPEESLYALKVADRLRGSAEVGMALAME